MDLAKDFEECYVDLFHCKQYVHSHGELRKTAKNLCPIIDLDGRYTELDEAVQEI